MQRKHIISLCILLCVLAVLVAFRPSADETMPPTGSASAGLILLDGQSGGFYVLAVIDQSRADRAGIEAGDTLLTLNSQSPADLTALDAFFHPAAALRHPHPAQRKNTGHQPSCPITVAFRPGFGYNEGVGNPIQHIKTEQEVLTYDTLNR